MYHQYRAWAQLNHPVGRRTKHGDIQGVPPAHTHDDQVSSRLQGKLEDLLPQSAAYRQAGRILFADPVSATGRPLTPLHAGHVGLLACSGLLNGIFGQNDDRHISFWQAVKVVDKTEEEEDGVITVREKERFSNELTVVFSTGQVAILK